MLGLFQLENQVNYQVLPSKLNSKEYGSDEFEIQQDVIPKGAKVLIVDDILATGGSAFVLVNWLRKQEQKLLNTCLSWNWIS